MTAWAARARNRTPRPVRAILSGMLAVLIGVPVAHAFGLETPRHVLVLGALVGLSYGLLGVCLVLVFRITHVVNFAQPAIGTFAASLLPFLVRTLGLPYWVGFALILAAGFALGALVDLAVVRRLAAAPRVVVAIATIGVAITLSSAASQLALLSENSQQPLSPPGLFQFQVGALLVTKDYTGLIIAAPLLVIALTIFMARTRYGLEIRASASNPDAASLVGISPRAMTALAWGIAGLCAAALSAFFTLGAPVPGGGAREGSLFTSSGLLPALAAAALARMTGYARALVAGVVVGMIEQVLLWSNTYADQTPTVLFVVILVALLFLRSVGGRAEPTGAWSAVTVSRPLPHDLSRLWSVRLIPVAAGAAAAAVIAWRGLSSESAAVTWTQLVAALVVSLSAALITGLGGDLSLGQYAVAGVGAAATYLVVNSTGSPVLALVAAALAGGAVCTLLAYPALRVGGLTLTILTVSFATMLPNGLLKRDWLFGPEGQPIAQPVLGSTATPTPRAYFLYTFVVAVACAWAARNVWRGGFGRIAIAARDNTPAARSFSIPTTRARMQLFFIAGAIAGIAGALIIQSVSTATARAFPPDYGALIVLAVVLGGVGAAYGGPLGTLWVLGIPLLTGADASGNTVAAAYSGALVLMLACPRGAADLLTVVRDVTAVGLGRLHGVRLRLSDLRGEGTRLVRATSSTDSDDHSADAAAEAGTEADIEAGAQADTGTDTGTATGIGARTGAAAAPTILAAAAGRHELPHLRSIRPRRDARPDDGRGDALLEARGLTVSFGPIKAVRSVDLSITDGEILGLIGPNGAGKTTTFEALAGFVRPTSGTVTYGGRDVTRLSPEKRAAQGLVRSFQDAALFPTMSVLDVVTLSLERQRRSSAALGLLGLDPAGRRRRAVAHDLVEFFGLGRYVSRTVQELSTGTRRIVELACLTSLQPRVLLLDEPSAGIAQRETEALAVLIRRMRSDFDMTIALIEHDIPLVMALADRMVAMSEGEVICVGTPHDVRGNEAVIECYLGTSTEAIERSDIAVGL